MNIKILTAVWKRPEIFHLFAEGAKLLDCEVVCVGSEPQARSMVKSHGFTYVNHPNQPLYKKWNTGAQACKGADAVLMLGSDDIITPKLFEAYKSRLRNFDYVYLTDCYFFDTVSKKALYWGGYLESHNRGDAAGVGRMLSKNLLDQLNWQPWEAGYDAALDTGMDVKLSRCSFNSCSMKSKESGYALDIKSKTNMTPFEMWPNTKEVNAHQLLNEFPIGDLIYQCSEE